MVALWQQQRGDDGADRSEHGRHEQAAGPASEIPNIAVAHRGMDSAPGTRLREPSSPL